MRSRYIVRDCGLTHFITSTIVEWLPVFTTGACCDILMSSLDYCQRHKALKIYGWVIMENHFHAVVSAPDLTPVVADLKIFTAKMILEQVRREERLWLLNQLSFYCARHKTRSNHQVWQEGFHPQAILDDEMMIQKLDYIHNNPVNRGAVVRPEHWRYSSAHEWLPGAQPVVRCDPWR